MHPVYTRTELKSKKLNELKAIAALRGITPEGNKAHKQTWIEAIEKLQSNAIWRNAYAKTEEQPATLKPLVEMNGDECIVDGAIVATITSDDDLTQPWVVKINSIEVHRAPTWARAYDYVRTHAKYGTLPNPQIEQVNDYLFHDDPQPVVLPVVGESHFIGSILLRCIQTNGEYAAVWDVINDGLTVGEISMGWDCNWWHTLSFTPFATPQEATIDLIESAASGLIEQELEVLPVINLNVFAVTNRKTGKRYEVSSLPYFCTCPHWAYRRNTKGFKDKHIDAVKVFLQSHSGKQLCN